MTLTDLFAGAHWKARRVFMWGGAALLLAVPFIAMQFPGTGFDWDETDFIVFGLMLATACSAVEVASRLSDNGAYRLAAMIAVGVSFFTVWANLAIGMIGSEDNSYNLLFGGVLALALLGSVIARFQPRGMVFAMLVAAGAQFALAAIGYPSDPRGGTFSMVFALPWLLSAGLFRYAAR